jgi:methionyl-tRNA formyltransferase
MRLVFLGSPLAACLLHEDGHEIVLAGLTRSWLTSPAELGSRRAIRYLGHNRVYFNPKLDSRWVARMSSEAPDLLVKWEWWSQLPNAVLELPRLGSFGMHDSLLPRHRGPAPVARALLGGDDVTGVSAYLLGFGNRGDVLDQEIVPIEPAFCAWKLQKALKRASLRVLRRVVERFAHEGTLEGTPQDEAYATAAPILDDEECVIQWSSSAVAIERLVRAAIGYSATMTVGGRVLEVESVTRFGDSTLLENPGDWAIEGSDVLVACADGVIRVDRACFEGEELEGESLVAFFRRP